MKKTISRRTVLEIVCIGLAILIVGLLLHHHTPKILVYLEQDDITGLTDYIRGEGQVGEIVLIALQVVETVSIFLPALPVYICAGILYGKVEGILLCYVTNLVINAGLFLTARKTGFTIEKIPKYGQNPKIHELLDRIKNPNLSVLLMSLLPVVPNGLIPYLAASTKVTFPGFMGSLAIGCLPAIALDVVLGDALLSIDWRTFLPVILVIAVLAALIFLFKKPLTGWFTEKLKEEKSKEQQK